MLTKIAIRNFKRFVDVEIELGSPVVFVGPNNSGKTSVLQALSLWDVGLKRWEEKRAGKRAPDKRSGVALSRRDLVAIPVPNANLLWRKLHLRDVREGGGRRQTKNVRIDIQVDGVTEGRVWTCGLEFDYANEELLYCRPLRLSDEKSPERIPVPEEAASTSIAFLPPMSGLAATETRLDPGAVNVRIGEGRTAEVLRNLCYRIHEEAPDQWPNLVARIEALFGASLGVPHYIPERGEVVMDYEEGGQRFDLSSSGRGLQQTMLLLAYMIANPGTVLLLDEPDAHLEVLRQRQIYGLIRDVARESGSQIVAASHSEVVLNEAADQDLVIAFVGRPHRIDDRGSQVKKALREIGFDQVQQAEERKWVLYLEGSTDLSILRVLARRLGNDDALRALDRPFVRYVGSDVSALRRHFHGLREAVPLLRGVALFDRLPRSAPDLQPVVGLMWEKRELENYICTPTTLDALAMASARSDAGGTLFETPEAERRVAAMRAAIDDVQGAMQKLGRGSPWSPDTKVSDDFLDPLFRAYYGGLGLPNLMAKKSFYELAEYVPIGEIDPEVGQKLDAIAAVAAET